MNRRTFTSTALTAATLSALGLSPATAQETKTLKTMEGKATGLMDNIIPGKWNLVMLWSVTCGICARETPRLSELYEEEKEGNLTLIGISIDGVAMTPAVADWMSKHNMTFPNLVGEFAEIAENFEGIAQEPLRGTPTFLMFDPDGNLAAVNPGPVRPSAVRDFVAKRA